MSEERDPGTHSCSPRSPSRPPPAPGPSAPRDISGCLTPARGIPSLSDARLKPQGPPAWEYPNFLQCPIPAPETHSPLGIPQPLRAAWLFPSPEAESRGCLHLTKIRRRMSVFFSSRRQKGQGDWAPYSQHQGLPEPQDVKPSGIPQPPAMPYPVPRYPSWILQLRGTPDPHPSDPQTLGYSSSSGCPVPGTPSPLVWSIPAPLDSPASHIPHFQPQLQLGHRLLLFSQTIK